MMIQYIYLVYRETDGDEEDLLCGYFTDKDEAIDYMKTAISQPKHMEVN